VPHLTKDGRIADIGRVDTDYETLSEFIQKTDPNLFKDKLVASRLAWLQPVNTSTEGTSSPTGSSITAGTGRGRGHSQAD